MLDAFDREIMAPSISHSAPIARCIATKFLTLWMRSSLRYVDNSPGYSTALWIRSTSALRST
jgi:hypothetical protein